MKIKNIKYIIYLALVFLATACSKDYLDVNTDPNNPADANVELLLPPVLGYTAFSLGNPYQIAGGLWSQYWTQGPVGQQYSNLDQYVITSTTFSRPWEDSYAGVLTNCSALITKGTAIKDDASLSAFDRGRGSNYAAIGKIMQAYVFQLLTDTHGDIPFTDALKGRDEDGGNLTPVFDPQQTVYDGLITLVDEGKALIDVEAGHPGTDDFFYEGDMEEWTRFANTLKLKIYLRQAYVRPDVARQGIQAMYAAEDEFLGEGEDAVVPFTDNQFNRNPLFTAITALSADNLIASQTSVNYLSSTDDPRIEFFFAPASAAPNTGNYVGILQGNASLLPPNQNANSFSKPSPSVGGKIPSDLVSGASAPVIFMSAAESLLLQAEAVVRGWGAGDANGLYNDAIDASFSYWGLTTAQATAYKTANAGAFPVAGTEAAKIEAIITQKWASMTGTENIEAWTEWRRTGYPDFFTVSTTNSNGGKFPARLLYPDTEVNRNPNTPAQQTISDKVWWDVNTNGQN